MSKFWSLVLTWGFICFILISCSKPGKGGDTDIDIRVLDENAVPVVDVPVYIQYGTQTADGNPEKNHDDVITTNYKGQAVFENMRKGEYFFFARAILDTTYKDTSNQIQTIVWGEGNTNVRIATRDQEKTAIINLEPTN